MSLDEYRRRKAVIDGILADPSTARTGRLPARRRAEIEAVFGDEDGLLLAMYARWFHAFGANLDDELEAAAGDLAAAVRNAWRRTAERHPALRTVLGAHAQNPRLAAAVERGHRLGMTPEQAEHASRALPPDLWARPDAETERSPVAESEGPPVAESGWPSAAEAGRSPAAEVGTGRTCGTSPAGTPPGRVRRRGWLAGLAAVRGRACRRQPIA
ncbi:hypothetical protein [Actinomadura sp. 9N215]|uniref:hypothetical protein n=1 Tax=Actinomadura sp. 9N215 TaxID=3375150 RepID=UPI0037B8766B